MFIHNTYILLPNYIHIETYSLVCSLCGCHDSSKFTPCRHLIFLLFLQKQLLSEEEGGDISKSSEFHSSEASALKVEFLILSYVLEMSVKQSTYAGPSTD